MLSTIGRVLLIVVNILFLLIGLGLMVVGFILRFGRSVYEPVLESGMDLLDKLLTDTKIGTYAVKDIDIGEAMSSLAIGFIIGGLILVALSFLGCCGACCKISIILWIYAILVAVFVLVEIIAIGVLYAKTDVVTDKLKSSMSEYKGLESSDVYTLTWNIVMIEFECCGVDSYKDFAEYATNWKKPGGTSLVTPITCCKTLPSAPSSYGCAQAFDATKNNGEKGCFKTIWDKSFANTVIVVPVLVVCGLIQISFIVFAIIIAKSDDKISPL
ncbi:hypothetical protein ACF0H5_012105 [Mactra antiquata]